MFPTLSMTWLKVRVIIFLTYGTLAPTSPEHLSWLLAPCRPPCVYHLSFSPFSCVHMFALLVPCGLPAVSPPSSYECNKTCTSLLSSTSLCCQALQPCCLEFSILYLPIFVAFNFNSFKILCHVLHIHLAYIYRRSPALIFSSHLSGLGPGGRLKDQ